MRYNLKLKKMKEIDRRKLQKLNILINFKTMKSVYGGNLKFIWDNKINNKISVWHTFSCMT